MLGQAMLVHIYPPGSDLGTRYLLNGTALVLGRGNDCDIQIHDLSVSRHHARIQLGPDGYYEFDLQSTNGTYVNDVALPNGKLNDGDYLRVGNCIYRFLSGDNVEAAYHEEICRRAVIDGLTDIHNQQYLVEYLDRELVRSARYHRPLTLALFDVDNFKTINDDLGHLAGDLTLRELARRVKAVVRKDEEFARYGGDEFGVVLPETTAAEGAVFAERIRALVEQEPFQYEHRHFSVTVSLGLATTAGDANLTSHEFIRQADERLYQAKREGRNRVVS
jgi:diguanylate cyclase (GGDEF)-like protein